ncbi:MarR family transcriptional regulator [Streptomyces sp. NPDC015661]|uniref:MarR family transcriptional regulator n=1 Tax=Streptomyces sp. NPDC015661 TaxID=3364961 RepID=UPI0036FB1A39
MPCSTSNPPGSTSATAHPSTRPAPTAGRQRNSASSNAEQPEAACAPDHRIRTRNHPEPLRDAMARGIDQLLHREWLRLDDGQRLHLTDAGEGARARIREPATEARAVVHRGISDEEYVAALKVLRRMVANVERDGTPGSPSWSCDPV